MQLPRRSRGFDLSLGSFHLSLGGRDLRLLRAIALAGIIVILLGNGLLLDQGNVAGFVSWVLR